MPSIHARRSLPPVRPSFSSVGWLLGHAILFPAIVFTGYLLPIVLPVALGIAQALLLGSTFGARWRWGVTTLMGVLLGYVAWWELWMIWEHHGEQRTLNVTAVVVALAVMGVCVGIPQAWIIWGDGGPAAWRWVPASIAGWLALAGCAALPAHAPTLLGFAGSLAAAGTAYGIITGLALAWLIHDRHTAARRSG